MSTLTPAPPTPDSIRGCLRDFETLEKYKLQESALNQLFTEFCPGNENASHVILKVSALNDFYSTNIFSTHPVAEHIIKLNISNRLAAGDPNLVNELALVTISGKKRNFYSFASKYCSHHNPEDFPIYDSYVDKMLRYFRRIDKFERFRNSALKSYPEFKALIEAFRMYYNLTDFTLREIDIYLWLAGKAAFPISYGK